MRSELVKSLERVLYMRDSEIALLANCPELIIRGIKTCRISDCDETFEEVGSLCAHHKYERRKAMSRISRQADRDVIKLKKSILQMIPGRLIGSGVYGA